MSMGDPQPILMCPPTFADIEAAEAERQKIWAAKVWAILSQPKPKDMPLPYPGKVDAAITPLSFTLPKPETVMVEQPDPKRHIPIDEMTLDAYRRGVRNMKVYIEP